MNRYFRGVTLGVALAGGLLFSAVAQHGFARADGGDVITVDSSALPSAAHSASDNSNTNPLPSDFTLANIGG